VLRGTTGFPRRSAFVTCRRGLRDPRVFGRKGWDGTKGELDHEVEMVEGMATSVE